ncbi:carbon-nitrogen family hydrolase [Streptomyces sp. NPDC050560]|uniref:carbon-nitrogen family hydrolase n=1 Tax=Streptomyces sp. NPDC050560 TaxID=3365630 RepID=UPI0037A3E0B2
MRASLFQIAVDENESVVSRRDRVSGMIADVSREQRPDLVVLPELWTTGAFAYELFAAEAEPLHGATYDAMAKAARDAGVWLHAGSIPERVPAGEADAAPGAADAPVHDGHVLYNTSLVFTPEGDLAASYRKIHRFGFDKGEAVLMGAGHDLVTVRMPETTLGIATCYDLRFPELFRGLVDAGADTFVVPAGWPERRRAHWSLLARARAVEDQAFLLACGTAGTHAGIPQAGHSVAVDPWGEVLSEADGGETVLTVDFDPTAAATARDRFPVLRDRVL